MANLFDEVQAGIIACKGEWKKMAAEIPGVSYSFIAQIGRGEYQSAPTYTRLKAVHDYLRKNRKLGSRNTAKAA